MLNYCAMTLASTSMSVSKCLALLSLTCLSLCCSTSRQAVSAESGRVETRRSSQSAGSRANNPLIVGVGGGLPNGEEAWRIFVENGRYRLATAADFRFSEAATQQGGRDLKNWMEYPQISNDFNQDYLSKDVAILVVDTTRTDPNRFGLVIFNDTADADIIPNAHWLLRDGDLSRVSLSFSRDGLRLREHSDAGSHSVCLVRWDKGAQNYVCEKGRYGR